MVVIRIPPKNGFQVLSDVAFDHALAATVVHHVIVDEVFCGILEGES
jgi:hypothetical protein